MNVFFIDGTFINMDRNTLNNRLEKIYTLLDQNYPEKIAFIQYKNSFELLISVILSAQTTDRQVMEVTPSLFKKYPDPASLAKGNLDDIIDIIRSTGFFRVKGQNIKNTAIALVKDFNSYVPDTIEKLIKLPGVGRKSANVIVGEIFGKPAIIVDTHFGRVVRRLGFTAEKEPGKIEKDIAQVIPTEKQFRLSMTANLHGREACHARNPKCDKCFLKKLCDWILDAERGKT